MSVLKKLFFKKHRSTQVFHISLDRVKDSFIQIEHEAGWDVKQKLYWGYYFLDHNLSSLEKFSNKLKDEGLQTVEIRNTGNDNLFLLHVEEKFSHTPKSLFDRCNNLAKLAKESDIEVFDGWDVKKTNLDKGLVE